MNDTQTAEGQLLQWHPAFFAGLQIEFSEEADKLEFENEHQLGTKPMEIDVLIIKKESTEPIHKNIGRIFRKYNVVEYKSPDDSLNVDDFYKVYGYACFYKADSKKVNQIRIEELTITFVCSKYPRELIRHLREKRKYSILKREEGIYYIQGDKIPIQLILTGELTDQHNLWLRSLTNKLEGEVAAEKLIRAYGNHKSNVLYKSMMNIIVRANKDVFEEVRDMCEALEELMKDELEARERRGKEAGVEAGVGIGIHGMIQGFAEEGFSHKQIIEKIVSIFSVSKEKAEEYYQNFAAKQS